MKNLYELMEDVENYHELAVRSVEAFEEINRNKDYSKLLKLYEPIFNQFDKVHNFFDQIELDYFDKLDKSIDILFFHNAVNDMLLFFEPSKHLNKTLQDILRLAIYTNATNIGNALKNLWGKMESDLKTNNDMLLTILQYGSAMSPAPFSYQLIQKAFNLGNNIPSDFMPIVLLKKIEEDIDNLPSIVKHFSRLEWEKYHGGYESEQVVLEIVNKHGILPLSQLLHKLDDSSLWFVSYLIELERISIKSTCEMKIIYDSVNDEKHFLTISEKLFQKIDTSNNANDVLKSHFQNNLDFGDIEGKYKSLAEEPQRKIAI